MSELHNERLTSYVQNRANLFNVLKKVELKIVNCTSEKYELACLADSHAAQLLCNKEDDGCFSRFKPREKGRAGARCAKPYF